MKFETLDTRRPDVDPELLADYDALFSGGKAFHARAASLLPQRPEEPDRTYAYRRKTAHYLNYVGPIVSRFPAWLFTAKLDIAREPEVSAETKDFYTELRSNCDGIGTDLTVFVRERLTRALVQRRSWILVDFPTDQGEAPAETRADWEARKLGEGYLCPLDECHVIDWECDDRGELLYAVVKHVDMRRRDPSHGRDVVTATWTLWYRDRWERYVATYKIGQEPKPTDDIPRAATGPVATEGRVPLVRIEVPDELWAMNLLASGATEQMRSRNAESWGLARTCYAMRIFKLADPSSPPTHGAGYGMIIGTNDEVTWDAPPADAFSPIAAYSKDLKEELHRVASQMAYGVSYSASSANRSAESKGQDNKLFDIVLGAYGQIVCEAVKRIHDLLSLGRGDDIEWRVSGLDDFDIENATDLLTNVVTAQTINIPSQTFRRLMLRRAALAMVPDASDADREKIQREIDEGTEAEEDADEREADDSGDDAPDSTEQGPPSSAADRAGRHDTMPPPGT